MRRLHVVGKQEKFIASGIYRTYAGGEVTGLAEHWSIHEVGDGAQFIRVDVDGRVYDGSSRLIEALRTPEGQFERVDEHIYHENSSQPIKLSYTLFDEYVEVLQSTGKGLQDNRVDMPSDYGVWLMSDLLMGFTIAHAALQQYPILLFHPYFEDDELIYSTTGQLNLTQIDEKMLQVSGREINVTGFKWNYNIEAWLDRHDILMVSKVSDVETVLTRYARRPEPKRNA
jgi:hypothetical protein